MFRWPTITHFRDSSRHLVAPSVMARWNGEEPAKSGAVMYAPGGREGGREGGRGGGTRKEEGGSKYEWRMKKGKEEEGEYT